MKADDILVGITADNVEEMRPILSEAFDLVRPRHNWKDRIFRAVSTEEVDGVGGVEMVKAAVVFFTGSRPTFFSVENGTGWVIEAEGYCATIGA